MAGSRLDKFGTIFSRLTGLLRSGATAYQDRPVWYDVYRVFPPKYEPLFDRKPEITDEIPTILYKEDKVRAAFFKKYGFNPSGEARVIGDMNFRETAQTFIDKFNVFERENPSLSYEEAFEATCNEFEVEYQQQRPRRRFQNVTSEVSGSRTRSRNIPGESVSSQMFNQRNLPEMEDAEEDDELDVVPKRGRKVPVITAESLLSMFKEAKEAQKQEDPGAPDKNRKSSVTDKSEK